MTRRFTAMLLAVIMLPVMLLCGCSGNKELTVQQYYDEMMRCWENWHGTTWELSDPKDGLLGKFTAGNAEHISQLNDIMERRGKAVDDFKKMIPPEAYAQRHEELMRQLELEERWDTSLKRLAQAADDDEADKIFDECYEIMNNVPAEELFPYGFMKIIQNLKKVLGSI